MPKKVTQRGVFAKLRFLTALVLLPCLLLTACRHRPPKEELSDFERWASDPKAREELTERMQGQGFFFSASLAETETREKQAMEMDETAFGEYLRSLDLSRLKEAAGDKLGEDRLRGALKRMVATGEVRHWGVFEAILDSGAMPGADYALRDAVDAMNADGTSFGEFHQRLCSRLIDRIRRNDDVTANEMTICLMIDREQTLAAIEDPAVLEVGSVTCDAALEACLERQVLLNADHLQAMLEAGRERMATLQANKAEKTEDWWTAGTVAKIVRMLALRRVDGMEQEAASLLDHYEFDSWDAIVLSQAVTSRYGIEDMNEYMTRRYSDQLERSFPFDQGDELFRTWVAVTVLDGEVCNGGFLQYFANGYGYQFPDAVAGFERIGERDIHKILIRIRAAFDREKPAGDYSAERLQKVFDQVKELLDESDNDYYRTGKRTCAKLNLYLMGRIRKEREAKGK